MLVMTRKVGERIVIGDNVTVTVVRITGGLVRIGIEAPPEFTVVRRELTGDNTVVADDQVPPACPQPIRVTLAVSDAHAAEAGLDPGSFTVTRTGDTSQDVTVLYTQDPMAKNAAGKLRLPEGSLADQIEAFGFNLLSLTADHVMSGAALIDLHHDPFDCILLGVARSERLSLLTRDAHLLKRAKPLLGDLIIEA